PGRGIGGYEAWMPGVGGLDQVAEAGLLTGAAGIALALLAATTALEPARGRMLLGAVPPPPQGPVARSPPRARPPPQQTPCPRPVGLLGPAHAAVAVRRIAGLGRRPGGPGGRRSSTAGGGRRGGSRPPPAAPAACLCAARGSRGPVRCLPRPGAAPGTVAARA